MLLRLFAFFSCAALSFTGAIFAQPADISGTFIAQGITIDSNDSQVTALARQAFGAHGAYKLLAGAPTKLRLTKNSDTSITLTCEVAGAQHTQEITGATWHETTLRACDAALLVTGKKENLLPFFNAQLAFVSDRTGKKEIYTSDLFLTAVRPLTNYNSISITPHWTNDGTEVLFTTYVNNNFTDIFAVNVATGQRRNVIVGARGTSTGAVSNPRTGQIAFASSSRGNMDIYLAPSSGKGARVFVSTSGVSTDPAWSPDGSKLALTSGPTGRPGIHTVSASGGAPVPIRTGFNYSAEPVWNPVEPSKIAFTYQSGGFGLAVVDTKTGEVKKIGTGGVSVMHPSWCADGRHVVVTRVSGRSTSLAIVDTKTEKITTILSSPQMANCSEADYRAVR